MFSILTRLFASAYNYWIKIIRPKAIKNRRITRIHFGNLQGFP